MSKKQQQEVKEQEMFQYGGESQPAIGTEIMDPSLPSSLDFDADKKKGQYEGVQIKKQNKFVQKKGNSLGVDDIKNYTVKGKVKFQKDPKYRAGQIIKQNIAGYEVKAYDENKSGGFKSIWQTLVGYVSREIYFEEGYMYLYEKTKDGYFVHGVFKLCYIFKIFADQEQSKIRIVFRIPDEQHLLTKNFQVKSCDEIVERLGQQLSAIGLTIMTE